MNHNNYFNVDEPEEKAIREYKPRLMAKDIKIIFHEDWYDGPLNGVMELVADRSVREIGSTARYYFTLMQSDHGRERPGSYHYFAMPISDN
jgi:hypothetical protein